MYMKHIDDVLLRDMLALAGEAFREQLLADLMRCTRQLQENCTAPPENSYIAAKAQQQVLHELRGLGVTIGAAQLVKLCNEGEALPVRAGAGVCQSFCDRVVEACTEVSALIAAQSVVKP